MINLVKNELIKIFSKKSIYIILFIFLILAVLVYVADVIAGDSDDGSLYEIEISLNDIDTSTEDGKIEYADSEAYIEYTNLIQKYGEDSWQATIVTQQLFDIINEMAFYRNGLYEYLSLGLTLEELQEEYDEIVSRLDNGDWRSFAEEDLNVVNANLEFYENVDTSGLNASTIESYNYQADLCRVEKYILEFRLNNDICYGDEDYESILSAYESDAAELLIWKYDYGINEDNYLEDVEVMNYVTKQNYQGTLSGFYICKYKLENKISASTSSAENLEYIISDMAVLFIVIIGIMIGATIVSEEFNKGTIKLLLVRPYSRNKILFSKIIACVIAIIISMVAMIFMETIISGIEYGFDTLMDPIISYDYNTNSVISTNVFVYIFVEMICLFPMIFIIAIVSFMIGTVSGNASVASTIGYLLYLLANIIDTIVSIGEGKWLTWAKYIPTVNWDFTQYLHGNLPVIEGLTAGFSAIVCLITTAVILSIAFIVFKKKNVKNV